MDCHSETNRWSRNNTIRSVLQIVVVILFACGGGCSRQTEKPPATPPTLPMPHFSVPGGVYARPVQVSLTAHSPTAEIRYTLDGSEPGLASRKYSGPMPLSESVRLKARVFDGATSNSPVAIQNYVFLNRDLAGFDSTLPLVIIHTFGQDIPHDKKVTVCARIIETNGSHSPLLSPADFDGRCDLNIRGNTSLRYPKHSYHLKTKDDAHEPLKVPLLGLPKESDWVLYAPYPDKTLIRDVLAYEISNKMGRWAARTRFVELFLNESGKNLSERDYQGVYVLVEKIKRGKHRIPLEKLTPEDNAEPNITGGYIFKKDHVDRASLDEVNVGGYPRGGFGGGGWSRPYLSGPGSFPGAREGFLPSTGPDYQNGGYRGFPGLTASRNPIAFTSSQGSLFFYVEPKADEITAAQRAWLTRYVNQFEAVLYGPNFKDPNTGYAAYIDAGSFIDHHLLVEVMKNVDGFRFSAFYSKDRGGKITMGPIWDWSLSGGLVSGKQGYLPEHWYWPQLDDQQYSWFRRLFEDPDFAQRYVDRWGEIRTNQFAVASLRARIDELARFLDAAQARNFRRWPILGEPIYPNNFVGASYDDEVNYLQQWLHRRIQWIDQQFVAAPTFSVQPGSVGRGTPLLLNAPVGQIYYTLDGTDPRSPGGMVAPTARIADGAVVLNGDTTVFSRARFDNRWSYPALGKYTVRSP